MLDLSSKRGSLEVQTDIKTPEVIRRTLPEIPQKSSCRSSFANRNDLRKEPLRVWQHFKMAAKMSLYWSDFTTNNFGL